MTKEESSGLPPTTSERSIWFAPANPDWWVAVLFIVGSACFALGSFPPYAAWAGFTGDGVTYFVGSLFFTSAAFLQLMLSAGLVPRMSRPLAGVRWRTLVRAPHRPEWWASSVQFVGTLLFNISTFAALDAALSQPQPSDACGHLTSSDRSPFSWPARWPSPMCPVRGCGGGPKSDWSVAMFNMVGSIAFGVSALGAQIVGTTGSLRNAQLANLGTFVGAICFLAGAVLLIPDEAEPGAQREETT